MYSYSYSRREKGRVTGMTATRDDNCEGCSSVDKCINPGIAQ